MLFVFFVFKQKTAYEMRISDWSSDVCSSDLDFVSRRFCATTGFAPDRMMLFGRMLVGRPRLDEGGEHQFLADGAGEFDRIVHFASVERIDHRGQQPEKIDLAPAARAFRSEEHTSELQSLMRISYAVFCLKKKNKTTIHTTDTIYLLK